MRQRKRFFTSNERFGSEVITKSVQLVSVSNADDAAFQALRDICDLTRDQNIRIVGGQMIEIFRTAFPVPDLFPRTTNDADAALETQFAASGALHEMLTEAGYEATHGNSYKKGRQKIDLLVGNLLGRFQMEVLGDRAFDSAPGIQLALDAQPILIDASAVLRSGEELNFSARIPTLEIATCIKVMSYRSRLKEQDLFDLYYLLKIVESHGPEEVGGWRLSEPAKATRFDAQRAFAEVKSGLSRKTPLTDEINRQELSALISKWIHLP